jgi:hypothetical protein
MTRSTPTPLEQLLGPASDDVSPEAQAFEAALLPLQEGPVPTPPPDL